MKAIEKVNQVIQDKATDIAESSVQGEAKGNGVKVNLKPYCHRCLSKGNIKEDCTVLLVCDICSSQMLENVL
jgi:DNA-binding protein YbaB